MSTGTKTINNMLAKIEREWAKYGLRLNRLKNNVHFNDGIESKEKQRYGTWGVCKTIKLT